MSENDKLLDRLREHRHRLSLQGRQTNLQNDLVTAQAVIEGAVKRAVGIMSASRTGMDDAEYEDDARYWEGRYDAAEEILDVLMSEDDDE